MSGLSGVVAISAGGSHNIALKSDGTLRAWGLNVYAQLGDGTITNRLTPTAVPGLTLGSSSPTVSLNPISLSFAGQSLGTTSTAQTVALTNSGGATLNFISIAAIGDFAVTHNCGSGLSPGGSCTLSVTFAPTAAGPRTGSIAITSNAGGSPHSIGLSSAALITPQAATNYQGLWWKSPAQSESGWGINFAHQGDVIFATWFTYDASGKALWLSMTANKSVEGVYAGTLYQTRGPAFSAVPFSPAAVAATEVGSGVLTFNDGNNGSFAYIVNGISQTKAITKQVFGTLPTCTFGTQSNLALATNYQDLWWASPGGVESGWGVNFTHQGDTIFATWFTYDTDGTPLWLSVTAPKTGSNVFSGTLYRTSGPSFSSVPFLPANVILNAVGSLTLTFTNGNAATFAYTLNGVTQSKSITRQVFRAPGTSCQ